MWTEVDSDVGSETESDGEFDERAHLMAKQDQHFTDMCHQELLKAGGEHFPEKRLPPRLKSREEMCYYFFTIVMFFANMAAGVLSLVFRHQGLKDHETCDRPLAKYLLCSSIHGFANGVLLLCYLIYLCRNSRRGNINFLFLENTIDRPFVAMLETLLLAMAFTQIGLGILAEVWVGKLGLFPGQASNCSMSAPILFESTTYIGLYQDWIILFFVGVLSRIAFCCQKKKKKKKKKAKERTRNKKINFK